MIRGSFFITLSAAIALLLGLVHLLYTFHGSKLHPRDPDLIARMKTDSPRITSQTTIWRVWIGINATHSLCLILFGAVYGYLAMCHSEVLFNSAFLARSRTPIVIGLRRPLLPLFLPHAAPRRHPSHGFLSPRSLPQGQIESKAVKPRLIVFSLQLTPIAALREHPRMSLHPYAR